MARKAPGKYFRKGLSLVQVFNMFPDEDAAREWFEETYWPNGAVCPHCGTFNVQCNVKHPKMTHRCRDCPNKPFLLPQNWHRYAKLETWASSLGHRHVLDDHQPQGCFQHETSS